MDLQQITNIATGNAPDPYKNLISSVPTPPQTPATPTSVITSDIAKDKVNQANNFATQQTQAITNQQAVTTQAAKDKAAADAVAKEKASADALKQQEMNIKSAALATPTSNKDVIGYKTEQKFNTKTGQYEEVQTPIYDDGSLEANALFGNTTTASERSAKKAELMASAAGTSSTSGTGTNSGSAYDSVQKASDDAYKTFQDTITQLNNGTFPLTADEQAQIKTLQTAYDNLKKQQEDYNANYYGGMTQLGITSGRQRYAPEIQAGILKKTFDDGIQKIADIEEKASGAIAELKQSFIDKDYERVTKLYDVTQKYLADKKQTIKDIAQSVKDEAQAMRDKQASDITLSESLADLGVGNLTGDAKTDAETLAAIAENQGIDPNVYASQVYKRQQEIDKENKPAGDIGQYMDAINNGLISKDTTYMDFQAQLAEAQNTGKSTNSITPSTIYSSLISAGYTPTEALKYASSGTMPTENTDTGVDYYKEFTSSLTPQGAEYFNSLTDKDKSNVQLVVNGDALSSDIAKGMGGAKYAQQLLGMATKVDPTYSENVNKQRYAFKTQWNNTNGKAYNVRTGVNTGLQHLARLKELTDQLQNTNFSKYNSISQWVAKNINGPQAELVAQYQDTVALLATEIAKAYKGGVPDQQEVKQQVDSINSIAPKNVLSAIINNKVNLMSGLLSSQAEEYKKTMGKYPESTIINSDSLKALKDAGVNTSVLNKKIATQMSDILKGSKYKVSDVEDALNKGATIDDINTLLQQSKQSFNQVGNTSASTGMRTDRHNNPTAFTTDIAKLAGLKEGVDYVKGDSFSGGKYSTAKLLGNPIDTTIKVIDKIGFQTSSGNPRWTYINIPKGQWDKLSYDQKKNVIATMYKNEGGTQLKSLFV